MSEGVRSEIVDFLRRELIGPDPGLPAQQLNRYGRTRAVPFHPGGHDEQAVGADQRRQYAGTARQRRCYQGPADGTEPHSYPVVHAER